MNRSFHHFVQARVHQESLRVDRVNLSPHRNAIHDRHLIRLHVLEPLAQFLIARYERDREVAVVVFVLFYFQFVIQFYKARRYEHVVEEQLELLVV